MSWEHLSDIMKLNRDEKAQYDQLPPETCPWDGTVLDVNGKGERNCKMGDYFWKGGAKII